MKRLLIAALILMMCFSAGAEKNLFGMTLEKLNALKAQIDQEIMLRSSPENIAERARDALLEYWKNEVYVDEKHPDFYEGIPCSIEIRSTRVFEISETPMMDENIPDDKYFGDTAYIVEFVLFSHFLGSIPCGFNYGVNDYVTIHRSGEISVGKSPFLIYSSRTYRYDYSGIIDAMYDLGSSLNGVYDLNKASQ